MNARAAATLTGCLAATVSAGVLNKAEAKPLPCMNAQVTACMPMPEQNGNSFCAANSYLDAMSGVMNAGAESRMIPSTLFASLGSVNAVPPPQSVLWRVCRAASNRKRVPKNRKPALLQRQQGFVPCASP